MQCGKGTRTHAVPGGALYYGGEVVMPPRRQLQCPKRAKVSCRPGSSTTSNSNARRKGEGSSRPGCIVTKGRGYHAALDATSLASASAPGSGQQERVKEGRGSMPPSINNSSNSVTVSSQVGMGARWSCRPGYSFVREKGESLCRPWFIFSTAATRSSSPTRSKGATAGQEKAWVHAASPPPLITVEDRARLRVMAGPFLPVAVG
uniref:Sushi domain-containing protein n=1 Tax=Anopheles arabiensis TaxID=7173 RepID=A0A182IHR4_ANOAR